MSDRFARQRLLASVGDRGQQRIADAIYVVTGDAEPSAEIERQYLVRAGARHFAPRAAPAAPFTHAGAFHHAPARELAAGAWRALLQLRSSLERD